MLKKIIANFRLPSPLAISVVLFVVSLVFAFSFTNPRWGSELSETAPSRMAYGAVVPFLFAIAFVADCFAYFEKDLKPKTRYVFSLTVGIFEIISVIVCFILYANYSPERVIGSIFYPMLIFSLALCAYGIYIRAWAEKKRNAPADYEKETFFCLLSGTLILGFFPLSNLLVLGQEEYASFSMGVAISFVYLIYGLIAVIYSLCLVYVPALQKWKNASMSILSGGAMAIGAVGILLSVIYHNGGDGFAVESAYWLIASGLAYFLLGLASFFYCEIRKANPSPTE